MVILHPNIRRWSTVKIGLGLQLSQGTPLNPVPKWLWADELELTKDPQFVRFLGAFGGVHLPRDASILTHFRSGGEFQAPATKTLLDLVLPWTTQAAVGSWSAGLTKYMTIVAEDDANGRDLRVSDALPTLLELESSITDQGFLQTRAPFFSEQWDDQPAGAFTFTESSPADQKKFLHNAETLKDVTNGVFIGVARTSLRFPSGCFPWEHNASFPLGRKDGPMNVSGEIDSVFSDSTDKLRQMTDADGYFALEFKWPSQAAAPVVLTVTLNDCRLTRAPRTGVRGGIYNPFRATFENFGVPVLTLA